MGGGLLWFTTHIPGYFRKEHPVPDFSRPTIEDIQLEADCIDTLKEIDRKHQLGNAAANLLAWSPLIFIASNPNPVNVAFTIAATDWGGLISGVAGLERVKLLAISRDCAMEAARHWRNHKLKTFWNEMYNFYRSQADALDSSPVPTLAIDFGGVELSLPTELFAGGDAGDFSMFAELFATMESEMRSALNLADDEPLIDNEIVEEEVDDDPIPDSMRSGVGLLFYDIRGRSYARKRRFVRVPTGRTKLEWRGIRPRIVRQYKHFYIYDNPEMYSARESASVGALLACVGGLALIVLLAVNTGYFDPISFETMIAACGLVVGVSSSKAMFRVQNKWG